MHKKMHFTVYFDGTGNNKDIDTPKGAHTNVARLYEADQASGTNLARNSGHTPQRYDASNCSGRSEKIYFDGVGSQPFISLRSLVEGGTGLGGQARITQAYNAIVAFHNKYPDKDVDVNIVGFSRGAAQGRALANQFIERGVPKLDGQGQPTGEFLIPPGEAQVNKLGIFDTVASYGYAKTNTHLGKNLEINKNVRSTTHMVAMNEYRDTFRLTSALRDDDDSQIEEIKFAGAHSQVGGGYSGDVLAAGPYAEMYDRLQLAGIEMGPIQPEDRLNIQAYNEIIQSSDKVQQALIDSRLMHGDTAFKQSDDGIYQKINSTAFPMERGFFNPLNRQQKPFDHVVSGRGVVFENDESLSRLPVALMVEKLWGSLVALGQQTLSLISEFIGKEEPQQAMNEALNSLDQKFASTNAVDQVRGVNLLMASNSSRPTADYIKSLNLQAVPLPSCSKLSADRESQDHQRTRSFKSMEEKARGLIPSANVREAALYEHTSISGLVVAQDEHHILQKVGKTDQFVIHDRRDVSPDRKLEVGKSTAIVHEKGIGETSLSPAPKTDLGAERPSFSRR